MYICKFNVLTCTNVPISNVENSRAFHSHTGWLAESLVVLARVERLSHNQHWFFVPRVEELEDLVHGDVCDPEASLVVDGEAMRHVEERGAPGRRGLARGSELDNGGRCDWTAGNVAVGVIIAE